MKRAVILNLILLCAVCFLLWVVEAKFGAIYRDILHASPLPAVENWILNNRNGLLLIPLGWIPSFIMILRSKNPSKGGVFVFQSSMFLSTMSLLAIVLIAGFLPLLHVPSGIQNTKQ